MNSAKAMKAPVRRIIHHSLVDGPGNRTAVFLQGCNLKCEYCHNPETQAILEPLARHDEITWMTVEEVFEEIKIDLPFIRGVTVSGGECMLFPEFISALFKMCKQAKLTCLVDTNGTIDLSLYPDLMAYCDGVMLDVKAWDAGIFKVLTGGNNEIVKKNLKFLSKSSKIEELRIVCIPGQVDAEAILHGVKEEVGDGIKDFKLKLIRFRNHGVTGRFKDTESPSDDDMNHLKTLAMELGFEVINNIF